LTTSTSGEAPVSATPAKSFSGFKVTLRYRCGATASVVWLPIISV
jgi:hypothetical protein